ncbi:hypothetical protein [Luteimonas sp. TWI1416]|uniref:hypothetical protein n=1 Tax=unclassified Luteimonas TaxID=2629088 RepID=UPI003208CD4E
MRLPSAAVCLSFLLLACVACPASAQDAAAAADSADAVEDAVPDLGTGDAWLDTWLADVDLYAARYRDAFVDEVARYQVAPRALVEQLLDEAGMRAGDVYFACAVGRALGRSCREIAAHWRRDRSGGWVSVLERLDVPPGGEPVVRVKRGLVASYDRWARPIRLDASLRRAFPDREP